MNIVEVLRKCIHREREVLAVFQHGDTYPGWASPESFAPEDQSLVVCGATVNGEGAWSPLIVIVGEFPHGHVSPYLLTHIPPRQSYRLESPTGPYSHCLVAATIELLGWTLPSPPLHV